MELTEEDYRLNIFRPVKGKPDGKVKKWIKKKMVAYLMGDNLFKKRFTQIHVVAKNKIFKVLMKRFVNVIGEHMVKGLDDIPAQWYNNHIRIFYNSWQNGLDDMFTELIYKLDRPDVKGFENKEAYLAWLKNSRYWSHENRQTIINVWITEILEDTADREWLNFFMLRMWHDMNDFYKGNVPKPGDYPVYTSPTQHNREYFEENRNEPVWKPKARQVGP